MLRNDSDHFDYDDDLQSTGQGKSRFPVWLIVLLCALTVVAVLVIGGGFVLFSMRTSADIRERTAQDAAVAQKTTKTKRVSSLRELKAMVGATPENMVAAMGEPDEKLVEPKRTTWTYHGRIHNLAGVGPDIKIVFEDAVVVEVIF